MYCIEAISLAELFDVVVDTFGDYPLGVFGTADIIYHGVFMFELLVHTEKVKKKKKNVCGELGYVGVSVITRVCFGDTDYLFV